MISFEVLVLLVIAAINAAIFWLILSQGWKNASNRYFASSVLFVILWILGTAIFYAAPNRAIADFGMMLFYIAPMFTVTFLSLFASTFRSQRKNPFDFLNTLLVVVTVIVSIAIMLPPPLLTAGIEITKGEPNVLSVDTFWYGLYVLYFNAAFLITFFKLFIGIRSHVKIERQQFKFIFVGTFLTAIFSLLTNLMLPVFGNTALIWLGPTWSLFYVITVSFSIARHGLFDIRQTVVRTVAYAMSLLVLALTYYLLAYIVSLMLFQGQVSAAVSLSPINILLALLLAFLFQPIKSFFDRTTDQIFFRDRYNSEDFYARLNEVLTSTTELRGLLQRTAVEISDTLKSDQGFFFVRYGEAHHISAGTKDHAFLPLSDIKTLDVFVKKEGDRVVVTDLLSEHAEVQRLLISHKITVLMPLMRKSTIIGYLALGEHRSSGYTDRDIKVLTTISDQLLIAIQNTLSVQEVKDINTHLQQRIDAATKELKTSNAQLRHLDATKDEFLSMASHQLRTPLTSVKGYLSMVLEGDTGKINDMQKHLLSEAFTSSERMVHLIHDFLNVSRLQTGKFMLELRPVDLGKLLESEVGALRQVADARNMKLEIELEKDVPLLRIDETKLQQVIMNYIDNALYYSRPENPVVKIRLSKTDEAVELRVIDGGIGVPKVEQQQLFEKFFRANNARRQRPDGTGVGIYLAKKVINAHGGEIIFESEEGKGSTFGFSLPIKKLEVLDENTN